MTRSVDWPSSSDLAFARATSPELPERASFDRSRCRGHRSVRGGRDEQEVLERRQRDTRCSVRSSAGAHWQWQPSGRPLPCRHYYSRSASSPKPERHPSTSPAKNFDVRPRNRPPISIAPLPWHDGSSPATLGQAVSAWLGRLLGEPRRANIGETINPVSRGGRIHGSRSRHPYPEESRRVSS
jgi:hypothetical protein